jgi:predicted nucleotidyltransferase
MENGPALVSQLKEKLPPILDDLPVLMAYLYGSAASGHTTPFSDVDIALYLSEPLPPRQRLELELGDAIVHEILQTSLNDFGTFVQYILDFTASQR